MSVVAIMVIAAVIGFIAVSEHFAKENRK